MDTTERAKRLTAAREMILRTSCGHATVCADEKCRAAGHEHESYGEDGWSCGEECPCLPACEGHEPETCEATTEVRSAIEHLDNAILAAEGK